MKKHILIVGAPGSGKTTLALETLKAGFNVSLYASTTPAHTLWELSLALEDGVKFVLIEDIKIDWLKLPEFKSLLTSEYLQFRKAFSSFSQKIPLPTFVFTAVANKVPTDNPFLKSRFAIAYLEKIGNKFTIDFHEPID